ncbi:MAG TPA: LTA synthase family protein, partial [Burkholderiales bacterium]|nr:LTA synthase family protein [Burkholderiales bacterium]
PFFGIGRALLGFAAFILSLYLGFTLETSLLSKAGFLEFGVGVALLLGLGAGVLWVGTRRTLPITFDPAEDLRQFGLLASLWGYALAEQRKPAFPPASQIFASRATHFIGGRPHIVAVQSESFFDARRLFPGINSAVLRQFDDIRKTAVQFGRLEVPAWGANTVRTEFAFLSGLSERQLNGHRFNPYRKLGMQGVPTIAGFLKRVGYRTVCVHPYAATFYRRDRVLPALGFDQFIDVRDFLEAEKCGPFIGDVAVAEKVRSLLGPFSQPTFIFVITMENHGPLHLEQVAANDVQRLYAAPPPAGFEDLTIYLRHLSNADQMIRMLREHLEQLSAGGWLCWYGDHVPIMPSVYQARDFSDARTDYFIWGRGKNPETTLPADIRVEDLSGLLLEKAGLMASRRIGEASKTLSS